VNINVQNSAINAILFLNSDTTTLGSWKGVYGQDGNYIVQHSTAIPPYSNFNFSSANAQIVNATVTDPRALLKVFFVNPTDRIESQFAASGSEDFYINANDNQWHRVGLYFCDYDLQGRSITVEAHDATSGGLIDSRPLTNYTAGIYLVYQYRGSIDFRIVNNILGPSAPTATFNAFFWGGPVPGDITPPTVAVTAPVSAAQLAGTKSVSASASDNVAVVGVQFQLDGVNISSEVKSPPYSVSWNTTLATNGNHTITAVARDANSNYATSTGVQVTVDNQAPAVSVSAPAAGATVTKTVSVTATATDNIGVVGVQLKLDGVSLGDERTSPPFSVSWDTTASTTGNHSRARCCRQQ
jgi:hypothetical protein